MCCTVLKHPSMHPSSHAHRASGVHAGSFAAQCSATGQGHDGPAGCFDCDTPDALGLQLDASVHSAHSWWLAGSWRELEQEGGTGLPNKQRGRATEADAAVLLLDGLQEMDDSDSERSDDNCAAPAAADSSVLSTTTTICGASPQQHWHSPHGLQASPAALMRSDWPRPDPIDFHKTEQAAVAQTRAPDSLPAVTACKRGEFQRRESVNQIKIGLKKLKARSEAAPRVYCATNMEKPRMRESESDVAPGLLVWIPPHMRGKGVSTIKGDLHRM